MVAFDDLVHVDPNAYAEEASNWQRAADGIRDRGNDLDQKIKKLETWQGAAAEAASNTPIPPRSWRRSRACSTTRPVGSAEPTRRRGG
jgi:hypothetical protein